MKSHPDLSSTMMLLLQIVMLILTYDDHDHGDDANVSDGDAALSSSISYLSNL